MCEASPLEPGSASMWDLDGGRCGLKAGVDGKHVMMNGISKKDPDLMHIRSISVPVRLLSAPITLIRRAADQT